MFNAGILKKALIAFAAVLFFGQGVLVAQADLNAAIRKIRDERYSEALADLNKLNAEDPRNEKIDYQIGRVYLLMDKLGNASEWFRKGQGHGQRYPMNHIGLGAVQVRQQNFDGAKESLAKGLEFNKGNDPNVILEVAEAYMGYPGKDKTKQQPYLKEAELHLYKVQKLAPNSARSFVLLGKLYGLQNVEELEQSMYEKAIELDPKFIEGHFRLGQLYKKQEKYNEAASSFEKCMEIDATYAPAFREMAEMWFLAKKFNKANEFMTKYLALMGNDKGARMRQCIFQYLGEKYDESIPCMEEMLKDTNSVVFLRLLGYSYVKKESPDGNKAMEYMKRYFQAAEGKKDYIIASDYENKAAALQLMGKDSLAILDYEKAYQMSVEKGEPDAEILSNIADIYKAKKDHVKRAAYITRYLNAFPNVYKLKENFDLGQAFYLAENFERSDSVFQVMTEKKPELVIGHAWRAKCNSQLDPDSKEGRALPYYQKVLDLLDDEEKKAKFQRDYVTANRYLGAYYTLVTEECDKALPYWESILSVKPEDEGSKNAVEYCKQK